MIRLYVEALLPRVNYEVNDGYSLYGLLIYFSRNGTEVTGLEIDLQKAKLRARETTGKRKNLKLSRSMLIKRNINKAQN